MYFVIAYNFISQAKSGRSGILPAQRTEYYLWYRVLYMGTVIPDNNGMNYTAKTKLGLQNLTIENREQQVQLQGLQSLRSLTQ